MNEFNTFRDGATAIGWVAASGLATRANCAILGATLLRCHTTCIDIAQIEMSVENTPNKQSKQNTQAITYVRSR